MEYILNKIDPNLRQKVNDASKEGVVHGTKSILINKDKQQEPKKKKDYKLQKYSNEKKLLVDAVKTEKVEIDAFKENTDSKNDSKGIYLDVKK